METRKYFVLASILVLPNLAFATGYNYLPNDVYIKQQEEKAALEYRISTLETNLQNSPTLSVLNIESRISQLEQEKQTEINYTTGLYAKNGISNQLPDAIAKINAKYDSQIENLEQQIEEYEDMMSAESDLQSEIRDLKAQLTEIEQQMSQTTQGSSEATSVAVPSAIDIFEYLDTLPNNEAQEIMGILGVENNALYEEVLRIVQLKYPYGKPGSALYKWHSENSNIPPEVASDSVETTTNEPYVQKSFTNEVNYLKTTTSEAFVDKLLAATNTPDVAVAPAPEETQAPAEEPRSIWQSIVSFFKKIWWF